MVGLYEWVVSMKVYLYIEEEVFGRCGKFTLSLCRPMFGRADAALLSEVLFLEFSDVRVDWLDLLPNPTLFDRVILPPSLVFLEADVKVVLFPLDMIELSCPLLMPEEVILSYELLS